MKFLGCIINESAKFYFLTIAKKSWPFKLRMTVYIHICFILHVFRVYGILPNGSILNQRTHEFIIIK